jgi:hypothetical protein
LRDTKLSVGANITSTAATTRNSRTSRSCNTPVERLIMLAIHTSVPIWAANQPRIISRCGGVIRFRSSP